MTGPHEEQAAGDLVARLYRAHGLALIRLALATLSRDLKEDLSSGWAGEFVGVNW